jgi:hypothetical protein
MDKLTLPAAIAALVLSVVAAQAYTATGTITAVNTTKHNLTLSNGRAYVIPTTLNINAWHKGEKVKVTYSKTKNVRTASNVVLLTAVSTPKTTPPKTTATRAVSNAPTTSY